MEIFRSAVSRRASSRAIQALLPASNTLILAVSLAGQRLLVACRFIIYLPMSHTHASVDEAADRLMSLVEKRVYS